MKYLLIIGIAFTCSFVSAMEEKKIMTHLEEAINSGNSAHCDEMIAELEIYDPRQISTLRTQAKKRCQALKEAQNLALEDGVWDAVKTVMSEAEAFHEENHGKPQLYTNRYLEEGLQKSLEAGEESKPNGKAFALIKKLGLYTDTYNALKKVMLSADEQVPVQEKGNDRMSSLKRYLQEQQEAIDHIKNLLATKFVTFEQQLFYDKNRGMFYFVDPNTQENDKDDE